MELLDLAVAEIDDEFHQLSPSAAVTNDRRRTILISAESI
jgi:hypothetical protein